MEIKTIYKKNIMKRKILFFVLSAIFPLTGLWAQQDTLVFRYRRMALEYQQKIKMAESRLSGAESMLDAAKSDRLPKFDFSGNYKYYGVPLQLAPPADAPAGTPGKELHNRYSLNVNLTQPIITGGYLKNTKLAAMSQVEVMKNYLSLNRQEVMLNADVYYWNLVSSKEIRDLMITYRDDIGKFLQVIEDRVKEEIASKSELYQARVRYNDAQYGVIKAEKQLKASMMEMNRLLGVPVDTVMPAADSLVAIQWVPTTEDLTAKALSQRPEMNILKNQVKMNEYKEKITSSRYNPYLGVGVGGLWGSPSPGLQIEPKFNYNVMATLSIPIFYWGKKKEEVAAMRQETEVSRLEMDHTKEMITLEVQRSYMELQRSQEQLDFAYGALSNASSNVSLMIDRYDEGLASVLEVLDAQLYWEKSYFNFIQAKYQLNLAWSNYQRALGDLAVK